MLSNDLIGSTPTTMHNAHCNLVSRIQLQYVDLQMGPNVFDGAKTRTPKARLPALTQDAMLCNEAPATISRYLI
jgi:hypothetical protein